MNLFGHLVIFRISKKPVKVASIVAIGITLAGNSQFDAISIMRKDLSLLSAIHCYQCTDATTPDTMKRLDCIVIPFHLPKYGLLTPLRSGLANIVNSHIYFGR